MTDDVFEDLVNLYLDKEITSTQLSILRGELERNPHRRKVFESYCRMHQATHFAALSQCPVIPTLSKSIARNPHFWGFFMGKPAWIGAILIMVVASFYALYPGSPSGSTRMAETREESPEKFDRFYARSQATLEQPPLQFFRTLKTQSQPHQNWAYVQELRHLRAFPEFHSSSQPEGFEWVADPDGSIIELEQGSDFDFEYSSYEFKR